MYVINMIFPLYAAEYHSLANKNRHNSSHIIRPLNSVIIRTPLTPNTYTFTLVNLLICDVIYKLDNFNQSTAYLRFCGKHGCSIPALYRFIYDYIHNLNFIFSAENEDSFIL